MTKVSKRPLPREDWEEFFDQICLTLSVMKDKKDVFKFLNDLLTYTEKKMFSKRLQIARRLIDGWTYIEISNRLKVTDRTIAGVSEMIESGFGGFESADQYLSDIENKLEKSRIENLKEAIKRSENPIGVKSKGN